MKTEIKKDAINIIKKNDILYDIGDVAETVALIIQGTFAIQAPGLNLTAGPGSFLGVRDILRGACGVVCKATTEAKVYVFAMTGADRDFIELFEKNKEYAALMVTSLNHSLEKEIQVYEEFSDYSEKIYRFITKKYSLCKEIAQELGINMDKYHAIDKFNLFDELQEYSKEECEYFEALRKIPVGSLKQFFAESPVVSRHHVKKEISMLHKFHDFTAVQAEYLKKALEIMINSPASLFSCLTELISTVERIQGNALNLVDVLDEIIDKINTLELMLAQKANIHLQIDRQYMEEAYYQIMSGEEYKGAKENAEKYEEMALVDHKTLDLSVLRQSMQKIFRFAGWEKEKAQKMEALIQRFQKLPDKFSTDPETRELRNEIVELYYPLYRQVFLEDYRSEKEAPLSVEFFLRYGLLSEELLEESQLEELMELDNVASNQSGCHIFDLKQWFTAIMNGEREPSKSEYDLDYEEYHRERRKRNEITQQQYEELLKDQRQKFDYEIDNMFRTTHRLTSGNTSVFVPFLHADNCEKNLANSYLAVDKIHACINRICRIDFSVFYREIIHGGKKEAFQKEPEQKEVFPDIILMPGCGKKACMWQEISERRWDTPARFVFPVFFEDSLEKRMLYLIGCFRWELCRTMQGAYWNNIQIKSLTSEYSDFLQFYKKNRELSAEKKEKVKMMIVKYRNHSREIFAAEYMVWILQESKGAMVLNRPVREIMATYCPFSAKIREKLKEQPVFLDAMKRFYKNKNKKAKEYTSKIHHWEKENQEIPEEIKKTMRFYLEM